MTRAPQQHKQPSRKGKTAWRKNVDVSEVQDGLDNLREGIIKGGIVAEKPSRDIFTVDTTGSSEIQKVYAKACKPLKADQILAQRSAVPALYTRNRSESNSTSELCAKRRKGNGISHEHFERLRKRAYGGDAVPKDVIETQHNPDYDPWITKEKIFDKQFSFLEAPKPVRVPKTLRRAPISLLEDNKTMPAVPKPKAGTSYNPTFLEWDAILAVEGEKEVQAELQRRQAAQEEAEQQALMKAAQAEDELSMSLQIDDESAWEGFESEYEGQDWLKKKRPERKTQAERNKIKRRKEAEREAQHTAEMKSRAKEAIRIREIARELKDNGKDKEQAIAATVSQTHTSDDDDNDVDDSKLRRRKFGKTYLPHKDLELVLPDELQDSLRLLKPEGNLLRDRFRNVLVRGKVETRKPVHQSKKPRRTYTEKWTYKDFAIST